MAEALLSLESALILQDKFNIPLHDADKTISGGIIDIFSCFNGNHSDKSESKLSSDYKSVNRIVGTSTVLAGNTVFTFDEEVYEPSSSSVQGSQRCHQFEFQEIQTTTKNFNESLVIGHGGFGKVYKGKVMDGSSLVEAAIKRLNSTSDQGAVEFWAEVETLSTLQHCNVVCLFGYCNYEREMVLVYEYMSNGTLEDHLHKLGTPLSWLQRLEICIGAGRGLHYLHTGTGTEMGVIHRDVKSSNILLNESWDAKICNFGLSKIIPTNKPSTYVENHVRGTFGYIDPDYHENGMVTRKLDVYAFGVVLLEVLCRKHAVDSSLDEDQWGLALWVKERIKEGNLKQKIDSEIRGQISPQSLKVFVRVAERCLHSNPKQRPTMSEALLMKQLSLEGSFFSKRNPNLPISTTPYYHSALISREVFQHSFVVFLIIINEQSCLSPQHRDGLTKIPTPLLFEEKMKNNTKLTGYPLTP
ncbi:probable serine/threonine-protein kinase PBL25 [Rutidosis leptorrhynchoides]|uniref:probable serine/threonine-protein kinase PBL25 n=1 Tax=Rutidosis leptorrhynchoides TaxID=125765 RepID=UPI003A997C13